MTTAASATSNRPSPPKPDTTCAPQRLTPWHETWRQLQQSTRPHEAAFRRSVYMLMLSAVLHGLALACLLPIFGALLPPTGTPDVTGWHAALPWLIIFTLLTFLVQVLRWFAQDFDYNGLMADAIHQLRTLLGEQLRRMPLLRLQDKRTGEQGSVLLGNVDASLNYTIMIIGITANAILTPVAAALLVMYWDWRLGLGMLLIFPAIVPLYRWRRGQHQISVRQFSDALATCQADTLEYVQGLPVLRATCSTGSRTTHLHQSLLALEQVQIRGQKKGIKSSIVIASVTELGMVLVMGAGVTWIAHGSLNLSVLAAVAVMLVRFGEPLNSFLNITSVFELIETSLQRIEAMLAIAPLPQQAPAALPDRFDIDFDAISFAYAAGAPAVLHGFSARLPMHSMTALVGPSGGGKTTVTRLLMRHADPQQGSVRIGGLDLRNILPETLNSLISVVFQDVYLFNDTVLANIRMARPEATDDEVKNAARQAQCLDFIERLPQGWHTHIGEIGGRLSGGERQRISIARALLKNAPIVILDEPTAALDTESERAVQRAIETLVKERTVIVIAHRLSTIAGAQQIIVIDQGKALETGNHATLLAQNGRYAALWQAQQSAKQWRIKAQ